MQWHCSWAPIIMGITTHIYAVVFSKFITVSLQTFYILAKILRQFMARGPNTWECNYIIIYRVSYKFSFAPVCHLDKLVEMVFCYQNCSDLLWEKPVFEAEGREFTNFLRSLEQFIQTEKGYNSFWNRICTF